jgi:hypothetical protein
VDEFAEIDLPGFTVLNREDLRAVCDREQTREAIVAALQTGGRPSSRVPVLVWGLGAILAGLLGALLIYLVRRCRTALRKGSS